MMNRPSIRTGNIATDVGTWQWQSSLTYIRFGRRVHWVHSNFEHVHVHVCASEFSVITWPSQHGRIREGRLAKNADRRWQEFDDSDRFANHQRFNDRVIDGFPAPRTVNFLSMLRTTIVHYYTNHNRMIRRNGHIECNTDRTLLHARRTFPGTLLCRSAIVSVNHKIAIIQKKFAID